MNIVNPNDRTTLLLNAAWLPINITTARAACSHMLTGRIGIIDKFGNVHHMGKGGATAHNIENMEWFADRHVLESGNLDGSFYAEDQPILRSAKDFWPIPTVALTETRFFRRSRRGKPSLSVLAKLYKNTCQICLKKYPTRELTIEHVYPRSRGGTDDEWNVMPTCNECNRIKSDIHPYEDANGVILEDKIKRIPSFFVPHVHELREEWEKFLFVQKV